MGFYQHNGQLTLWVFVLLVFVILPLGGLIWKLRRYPKSLASGFVLLIVLIYPPIRNGMDEIKQSNKQLKARDLGLCFFQYANDHAGKYPEGKSSTEVFQLLLDGHYLSNETGQFDFGMLYCPMPGKVQASPGTKVLRPENICWDVTSALESNSPGALPVLYLTGFKITYQSGASAIPLPHAERSWADWWNNRDYPGAFIVVNYLNNGSRVLKLSPDHSIHDFIPQDSYLGKTTYRQLTP